MSIYLITDIISARLYLLTSTSIHGRGRRFSQC